MHRHDVHVDPIEAQEVVRLAAERQSAVPDNGPTINGLAEALGLAPVEIERLLAEVRARGGVDVAGRRRIFGDRSAAISAALALALFLVTAGGLLVYRGQAAASPLLEASMAPPAVRDMDFDVVVPPTMAPDLIPETIIVEPGRAGKHQEIERLVAEIERLLEEQSKVEESKSHLDQTLNELQNRLNELKKGKSSTSQ